MPLCWYELIWCLRLRAVWLILSHVFLCHLLGALFSKWKVPQISTIWKGLVASQGGSLQVGPSTSLTQYTPWLAYSATLLVQDLYLIHFYCTIHFPGTNKKYMIQSRNRDMGIPTKKFGLGHDQWHPNLTTNIIFPSGGTVGMDSSPPPMILGGYDFS